MNQIHHTLLFSLEILMVKGKHYENAEVEINFVSSFSVKLVVDFSAELVQTLSRWLVEIPSIKYRFPIITESERVVQVVLSLYQALKLHNSAI
jgi:hypothetical protein